LVVALSTTSSAQRKFDGKVVAATTFAADRRGEFRDSPNPIDFGADNPNEPVVWWNAAVQGQLRNERKTPVTVEGLVLIALDHSSQIRVFSDLPLIRETSIVEADAAFDWSKFVACPRTASN
jgi:hypothetical protein